MSEQGLGVVVNCYLVLLVLVLVLLQKSTFVSYFSNKEIEYKDKKYVVHMIYD